VTVLDRIDVSHATPPRARGEVVLSVGAGGRRRVRDIYAVEDGHPSGVTVSNPVRLSKMRHDGHITR
ncbi:MAG: hypothetical protein AAGP08_09695, partial [Pseudomonadota bacterium]